MPFLRLGYKRMHYADMKPAGGPARETLIFMHGLGSSHNYYYAMCQKLVASGFRCITFDTTGAGRSPYTFIEQSVETLSGDVVGILDAVGVDQAVFVGHSMGGDRIVAAMLIGPVYPGPALKPVFAQRIEAVEKDGMQPMADSIPEAAVGHKAPPLAKAMIRELLLAQDPAGYVSNCRVLVKAEPPRYGDIGVPVLIVAGSEDRSAPLEGCQRMFGEIGSSKKRLEVLEGVGHWHCLEAPDEVARLMETFYDEMQ